MWAFATTLWEIFSQGRAPTLREFYASKRRLLPPVDCPEYVYEIMREGWDESPDKRYSPQALIAKLMCASMLKLSQKFFLVNFKGQTLDYVHFFRSNNA